MSDPGEAPEHGESKLDPWLSQVHLRSARHARWLREGAPVLARHLGQIGVLGWLIVVPTLLGLFSGRWIDRQLHTGLTFSAALLLLGLALGSWMGWKWMHSEMQE